MSKFKKLEDLIMIVLYESLGRGEKCSFGKIVVNSFHKFPDDFSLTEYKSYPDSLKLDRPLRELREKGLISGSPITYYFLTPLGKKVAEKLAAIENPKNIEKSRASRSPVMDNLQKIEQSQHFKKEFLSKDFVANEMKVRGLVNLTMEAPKERVLSTLQYLKNEAEGFTDTKVIKFLDWYINYYGG
jgi:hypothetical protein